MNIRPFIKNHKKAFSIAFTYVGISTISLLGLYPKDPFYSDWSIIGLLITFPVSIFAFGYRFVESDPLFPILAIQFTVFILLFLFLSSFIKNKE